MRVPCRLLRAARRSRCTKDKPADSLHCLNLRCHMQSLRRVLSCMDTPDECIPAQAETYNPWSIVNLVFRQLAAEGLHPVLGESGDPGKPAAELLRALGIVPTLSSRPHVVAVVSAELARLREAFEAEHG